MGNNQQLPSEMSNNPLLRDPTLLPQPTQTSQKHSHKKLILFAVGGAVLALLAAGAVYWFVLRDTGDTQTQQPTSTQQEEAQKQTTTPTASDATPQTYKSEKLNIELTHRKDWTLKESSDGVIAITSPQISYAASDGKSKTGVFTIRIRKGTTEAQQTNIDKAIATRDSEVIAYTAPVESQRQYTNLSYVGPKDMFGFFIVTSNTEFKAGAPLMYALQFSSDAYLIAGGYGADVSGSLAFDAVPKAMMDSGTLTEAINVVKSLKIY